MSIRCDAKIGLELLDEKKYKELEKHLIYTEDLYKVRLLRENKYIELYNALRKDLKKSFINIKNILILLLVSFFVISIYIADIVVAEIKYVSDCGILMETCQNYKKEGFL